MTLLPWVQSSQENNLTLKYKGEICPFQTFKQNYLKCGNCHTLCSGCYGDNSYSCENCLGYIYQMNCVESCPNNYFSDENKECRTCNILYCYECQDIYTCKQCEINFDLVDYGTSCKYNGSKDKFAFKDEQSKKLQQTASCQNKGYQLNEQLNICESIPKCPIHNEILSYQYSCFQEKDKGIETTLIDNDRILLYNINQVMLFEYSTLKYIKEIQLDSQDSIISIQFINQIVFIIYENALKFYNSITFVEEKKFILPPTIKNNSYSELILLNNNYFFMTMNQQSDTVCIFDHLKETKLAEFKSGTKIEKLSFLQKNQYFAILSILNLVIYHVELQNSNILVYTKIWDQRMSGNDDFFQMRMNYFYDEQNKPHLIVETTYLICVINIKDKFQVEEILKIQSYDSNFLPQFKQLFIKFTAQIITYDLNNIQKGVALNKMKITPISGLNLQISSTNKYIYLTSTENNYSEIFIYDLKFNLITSEKIVNMYGRPVKFLSQQKCISISKQVNNVCDPNDILVLSVENNILFIQDFEIIKVVFENCMSQSNSYMQQTSKQLIDYERDDLRGLDFVVSINVYARLTFFILKLGISRQTIEITDPYLQNLQIDGINNISTFVDDKLRLIKILGVIKIEDKQKVKLAVTFRYNDFKIINIEKYDSIENIQKDSFLGTPLYTTSRILFQNYIGYNKIDKLLSYEFISIHLIKYLTRQNNYVVYSDKYQLRQIWIIDVNTFNLINYITIDQPAQLLLWQFVFGFFPNNEMYIAYNSTQNITYSKKSPQIKINELKFNYVPVRQFIDPDQNILIIEEQDIKSAFNFIRFYHIINITTLQKTSTVQPLYSIEDKVDSEWTVYTGATLTFQLLRFSDLSLKLMYFQIITWKNYPGTPEPFNVTSTHATKIHYVVTYVYNITDQKVQIINKEIYKFSRALYLSYEISNDYSVSQFSYINLKDSSQQINMLCQRECSEKQIKVRSQFVIYKNLIFPNVSGMLKLEFKYFNQIDREVKKVKEQLKVMLLDERQLILLIYQQKSDNNEKNIIIESYSYPIFKKINQIEIINPCEYNLFQIIKERGIIITCSGNQTTIYGIYTLKQKPEYIGFSHNQCCNDPNDKSNCLIKQALYSEKNPTVYFHKCGVLDYSKNIFYKNPEILIENKLSYYNETTKKYVLGEKSNRFLETQKYLFISTAKEILKIQKDQQYKLIKKLNPSNDYIPQFEKNFILYKLNFNSYSQILVQDYEFNPLQQFEQNDPNFQLNSTYYYDCPEQSMLFLLYNFKIEGFYYPFKLGSNDPQFLFKTKNYQVCACTDKYIVIQIETDKNNVVAPGDKVLYLQFIDVKNNKIYKELVLYKQNYVIDYASLAKNPIYIKEKAILILSNLLISLQSDFFQTITQRNLLYDQQFDFAILFELKEIMYFQIMDFSTIFPFKQEYYEITSSLQVSGFLIPKLNMNSQLEGLNQNKLLIQGNYWSQSKRSFIVYYQNTKQVIQFYDYEENKRIELKVQIPDLPNLQNYVMNIDLFQDDHRLDKIIFRGIIFDKMVFFSLQKIISIISINNFHELYFLSYFAEKDNQIYYLNFTKYNSTKPDSQVLNDSNLSDSNQDDFHIKMNSAPITIPQDIQEKLGLISQVRLFDKNRYIAFLDNINNLVLHDHQKQQTKMITLDFNYNQINEFHFKNYLDTFTIFISYNNDSVRFYDPFLQEVVNLTGFQGPVKYSYIDPHFQQMYFSDKYFIYAFKYDKVKFEDKKPNLIIKKDDGSSTYYLDQAPLQTRGNYQMKKISYENFAIISQSNCHIFNVQNQRIVLMSRIVNEDFINVRDLIQIDKYFSIVLDKSGVYIYQKQYQMNQKLLYTKKSDFLKILDIRILNQNQTLQILGVTANNVFFLEKQLQDFSQNQPARFKLDYIPPSSIFLQNILSSQKLSQCVGSYTLQEDYSLQLTQIENISKNTEVKEIVQLTFNVVKDNTIIDIPKILHYLNYQSYLNIIYNLQNFTCFIYLDSTYQIQSSILKQIEFINGQIIANVTNYQPDFLLNLTFFGFQSVKLTNIQIQQNIQFQRCKEVILDQIQFRDRPYYNITYDSDQNLEGYFNIKNTVFQTNLLNDLFIFIKYAKDVKIQNIIIQNDSMKDILYINQKFDDQPKDSIFYFQKMHSVLIDLITIEGVYFTKNLFFMGQVNNVNISNIILTDIKHKLKPDDSAQQIIDESLRFSQSSAIFDIQFLEQSINITKIYATNCTFSQFFNLRNYILNIQEQNQKGFDFPITIKSIIDSYQQFNVSISELDFKNITKSIQYPNTQSDQNILNIYGGNITIEQISFIEINNFHSCIFAHFGKEINISYIDANQIKQGMQILKIQNAEILQLKFAIFQQTDEIRSFITLINTPSYIQGSVLKQEFHAKDSAIYIKFDIIQETNIISFYETQIMNIISQSSGAALKLINVYYADLNLVTLQDNLSKDSGGGIYAQNSNITFVNVQILNNKANLSGGGIYTIDCELYIKDDPQLNKSLIKLNEAKIGGGIRYFSKKIPSAVLNNRSIFQKNHAQYFGDNFTFIPKKLIFPQIIGGKLSNVTSSQTKVNTIIDMIWIDEEDRIVTFIESKTGDESIQNKLNQEINNYKKFQISSKQILIRGQSSPTVEGLVSEDKSTVNIQLNLLFQPEKESSLIIKPIFDHIPNIYLENAQKEIKFQVEFRKCVQGEIFKYPQQGYTECERCDNNTYSLEYPTFNEKNVCSPCPESSIRCEGNQIFIKDGYWIKEGTSLIKRCHNKPAKCKFQSNNITCVEGNIGPRCESCDYSNIFWKNGTYGKTGKYDCQKCQDHSFQQKQIIGTIFYVLAFGIYQGILVIQLNNTLSSVLKGMYLKKIGIVNFSNTLNKNGFSTLTKFFISYLQLLQILNSFKFNFPEILNSSLYFFGNPLATSQFTFDCVLINSSWHKNFEIVYLRLVWNVFTTLCYFLITATTLFFYDYYQNREVNRYMSFTSFLKYIRLACFYMYYLVFPSFVIAFSNIISCEQIGGVHYIIADNQFLCNTENHMLIGYKICLPLLIVFVLAIPLFIFYKLSKAKNKNLFSPQIFLKYGFFFLEYKEDKYYWEIIKMIQKSLIYIICSVLNEDQILKGAILCFFMILYMKITYIYRPYKKITLNNLDFFTNFILLLSFQLGIINISAEDIYIQTFSLTLMFVLNIIAIFYFFKSILKQQIQLSPNSYLYPLFSCLKKTFPSIFGKIFNEPKSCLISHKGWSKVQNIIKYYKPHTEPYILNKFEHFQKIKSNYDTYRLIKSQNTSILGKLGVNFTKSVTIQSLSKLSFKKDNTNCNPSIFLKKSTNNDYEDSCVFNLNEQDEKNHEQKIEKFNFSRPKIDILNKMKSRDQQDSFQQFITGVNKTPSDDQISKVTELNELSHKNLHKKSTSEY